MSRRAIELLVRASGLTQAGFAGAIGVSVSTVSRWIAGRESPSKLALRALENFAGEIGYSLEEHDAAK